MKPTTKLRQPTDTSVVVIEKTEFFDPAQCEFLVHGFFEELIDATTNKQYGLRIHQHAPRKIGSDGRVQQILTQDEWLHKGPKLVLLRASKAKPKTVWAMIQPICGSIRKKNI